MRSRSITVASFSLWLLALCIPAAGQRPGLVIQTGHRDNVSSVAVSADGRLVGTGGDEGEVKLWDVATGRELKTFKGDVLAFSHKGTLLAVGDGDGNVTVWDLETGARSGFTHEDGSDYLTFSPDDTLLASAGEDIRIWNRKSGLTARFDGQAPLAFSKSGDLFASGNGGSTFTLRRAGRWAKLRTIDTGRELNALAFSPVAPLLAAGGGYSGDSALGLWDVNSGRRVRPFGGLRQAVQAVAFSRDGKLLAAGSAFESYTGEIRLWNVATGRPLPPPIENVPGGVAAISFSPDDKMLISGGGYSESAVTFWDVASRKPVYEMSGHNEPVNAVAFSPDGKLIASACGNDVGKRWDATVHLWSTASGTLTRAFAGRAEVATSVVFSPDGKLLAGGGTDDLLDPDRGDYVNLWDVGTGKGLLRIHNARDAAFLTPGNFLVTGKATWDVEKRKQSGTLPAVVKAATQDGRLFASVGEGFINVWEVKSPAQPSTLRGRFDSRLPIAFSHDGSMLAAVTTEQTVKVLNTSDGTEGPAFEPRQGDVNAVAFSRDGKLLASGGADGTVKVWSVETGKESFTLAGHARAVTSVSFAPDGRTVVSGSKDATMKLWDVLRGQELATLIVVDETGWLVVTPDGLFDGTAHTWKRVLWRFGEKALDVAPVEAFFREFFRPGLLAGLMSGERPAAPRDISKLDRRLPSVRLIRDDRQTSPTESRDGREVKVRIQAEGAEGQRGAAAGGVRDVRLFRNGTLVKVWKGDVLEGKSRAVLDATVTLPAGKNTLTVYAFNQDDVKSEDDTLEIENAGAPNRRGVLYVVAVGINKYDNPNFVLQYAAADARDFGDELKRRQQELNNYAETVVISLIDQDATRENISRAFSILAGADAPPTAPGSPFAALRRAEPEDAVVIFFSGHGKAVIGPGPDDSEFYLVPRDMGYAGPRANLEGDALRALTRHSISGKELQAALEGVDAGRLVLVVDACNSGQALEMADPRQGPMNSRGLAQLAYEKGMYVLAASQGYQSAVESSRYGHGYLTYALVVEGLRAGAADIDGDNVVTVREWFDYAARRVPEMQSEREEECKADVECLSQNREELVSQLRVQQERQRPRAFYRRDESVQFLLAKLAGLSPGHSPPPVRHAVTARHVLSKNALQNQLRP